MATLRTIRRRIASVKSTQQITKAMKMVAAARLRKAQERMMRARPYSKSLDEVLGHVAAKVEHALHPLLHAREPKRVAFVVITGDRGLCGSFNANIIRRATNEINAARQDGRAVELITVGKKAFEHFNRRRYPILEKYVNFFDKLDFSHAQDIAALIQDRYVNGKLDRIYLVFNEFKSAIQQNIVVQQLLPIVPRPPKDEKYATDFIFEPSTVKILDNLCPRYLNVEIWHALLESFAAEMGARMAAMSTASDNAKELIVQLTLYYNKVRQASITRELMDIVGGAEALKK
ncbi:MAG: ATP synthase F1 subunit gamma [candidate division KSB1 bacterium]|nr:ATP synthase F1 subunit gamma [candidate division KSB1 bacterium]MDZ7366373.1 ATP synthase F1 subunit gamma [candidate division KSB1 bacterium]MDZ7404028.1 ATP synthase F1 subunit gamma [candidate division KSB1 bacterium]